MMYLSWILHPNMVGEKRYLRVELPSGLWGTSLGRFWSWGCAFGNHVLYFFFPKVGLPRTSHRNPNTRHSKWLRAICRKVGCFLFFGLSIILFEPANLLAQKSDYTPISDSLQSQIITFLTPAHRFSQKRFYTSVGAGVGLYGAFSIGLWQAWYKDAELSRFHTFNDWAEWQQVDKIGHLYTSYNYSRWTYQGARWTGMSRRSAAWTSAGVGMLLQTTTEIMDGYASKWGYSWGDMTFNALGSGLFLSQELIWKEQRITMKVSSNPQKYPDLTFHGVGHNGQISIEDRTRYLYGESFAERFIKDYNAQVNWFAFNLKAFAPTSKIPPWLNVAVGYGAGNMVAGHGYEWTDKDGLAYSVDPKILPRYRQFFLSTDIELRKLPIKNRLLRTLIYGIHHIKFPGPALEYNTLGQVKMHWLFW